MKFWYKYETNRKVLLQYEIYFIKKMSWTFWNFITINLTIFPQKIKSILYLITKMIILLNFIAQKKIDKQRIFLTQWGTFFR